MYLYIHIYIYIYTRRNMFLFTFKLKGIFERIFVLLNQTQFRLVNETNRKLSAPSIRIIGMEAEIQSPECTVTISKQNNFPGNNFVCFFFRKIKRKLSSEIDLGSNIQLFFSAVAFFVFHDIFHLIHFN